MATNIPPHNLGELVDALRVLIHNPEATVSTLSLSLSLFLDIPFWKLTSCSSPPEYLL